MAFLASLARTDRSAYGLRSSACRQKQTRRPCQIRRWPDADPAVFGPQLLQIQLDFFWIVLFGHPESLAEPSDAKVSTTTTPLGIPNAVPSTTFAVLRATPGTATANPVWTGTLPPNFSTSFWRRL